MILTVLIGGCASNIVPPILLESGQLSYPETQKNSQVEGFVVIEYDVSELGIVSNPVVISANPPGVFDAAALDYIQTWRFQPKKVDGIAVEAVRLQSRITFLLDSGEASYLDFIK